jgi:hypothetical protein
LANALKRRQIVERRANSTSNIPWLAALLHRDGSSGID